jgi:hypothetical protein
MGGRSSPRMGCGALAAILLLMAAAPRAAAGHGREL